jgi:hypothetical protein
MNNMIIGVLLFVLGCLTSYYLLLQSFMGVLERIADKYEKGDVSKLLGRK